MSTPAPPIRSSPATDLRRRRSLSLPQLDRELPDLIQCVKPLDKVYHRRRKAAVSAGAVAELPAESSSDVSTVESPEVKSCAECSATRTPMWRIGPAGPKTLCNACGIRYKKRSKASLKCCQVKKVETRQETDGFLGDRNSNGPDEVREAATIMMALSCGFSFVF